MTLLLLAQEVQVAILAGEVRATERALRRVVQEPVWAQQSNPLAS